MLMFMLIFSWSLSFMFIFLNHPLSFGLILLTQTIIISLTSGLLNLDMWFSYILFLIMIGGLLILFIYMTSVASNEKFKFSKKISIFFIFILMTSWLSLSKDTFLMMLFMQNHDFIKQTTNNINLSMNKFTNLPTMLLMIMLMIYLLMTLIAIVKITQSKLGPLRSSS